MSQPPKSTIFAPAARCTALSGVCLSTASPGRQKRANHRHRFRPVCPFYLRDCGAMLLAPDAPSVGHPFRRPLSRLVAAPAQSWVPERLRELRLRRRSDRVGPRSPAREVEGYRQPCTMSKALPMSPDRPSGRYFFRVRIHSTRLLTSASDTCAFGGMGIWPQTPTPPFLTLSASLADAPASPLYFAATS